jgi:hypothetical protein
MIGATSSPTHRRRPFEGPEAKADLLDAGAKARKEALDAKAAADAAAAERASAEAAEAKARKEALDAKAAADAAAAAKAIAAEVEQAKQWRMKVDEARTKGTKYAEAVGSNGLCQRLIIQ